MFAPRGCAICVSLNGGKDMKYLSCMTATLALAMLAATAPTHAHAEFRSGNDVYRYCTRTDTNYDRIYQDFMCLAYIQGAHDGLEAGAYHVTYRANLNEDYLIVCVPEGVEVGQIKEIVVDYLRSHPADRNLSAAILVYAALAEVYPCAKS